MIDNEIIMRVINYEVIIRVFYEVIIIVMIEIKKFIIINEIFD